MSSDSDNHDGVIAEFIAITSANPKDASNFLKMQNWQLDAAVGLYLSANESGSNSMSSKKQPASAADSSGVQSMDYDEAATGVRAPKPQIVDQLLNTRLFVPLKTALSCSAPSDGVDPLSGEFFGGKLHHARDALCLT